MGLGGVAWASLLGLGGVAWASLLGLSGKRHRCMELQRGFERRKFYCKYRDLVLLLGLGGVAWASPLGLGGVAWASPFPAAAP